VFVNSCPSVRTVPWTVSDRSDRLMLPGVVRALSRGCVFTGPDVGVAVLGRPASRDEFRNLPSAITCAC
jgi:hypothetical protein